MHKLMKQLFLIATIIFFPAVQALAQVQDSTGHAGHDMGQHEQMEQGSMSHAFSRNLPMSRNGSGTGWLPDNSPMYGWMHHSGEWMHMFHGNVFLRYNNQDISEQGSRGDDMIDLPNWMMWMGQRTAGERGLFRISTMISLDPLTVGGEGYPLLFQSGETWQGVPLVDRQHPHDLFTELAVSYAHSISDDADLFGYLAYPGEPAFGPVAFMHRVSGLYNPDAPIGHHWQDATHITFGVGTVGFRYGTLKLEGSLFTGREPNEERYGFDRPRFDSWSVRLSHNPSPAWALQVSRAWVKDIHEIGPREDVDKTSASVLHSIQVGEGMHLNSAAVWGYNKPLDHHSDSHSFLLESAMTVNSFTAYGKYEWVEKSTEDLLLSPQDFDHDATFPVQAYTLGIQQNLFGFSNMQTAAGVQGTIYVTPDRLQAIYGEKPAALEIYLRLRPGQM